MTIVVDNVIRVTAKLKRGDVDDQVNVYHLKVTDVGTDDQQQLRDALVEYLESFYAIVNVDISDTLTYDSVEIFNVTTGDPEPTEPWTTLTIGLGDDEALPSGCCALMLGRTATGGVLGKKYLPTYTEPAQNGGVWTAPVLVRMLLAAAIWIAPFVSSTGSTFRPVVYSRLLEVAHIFTGALVNSVVAYQRRRKRGVGS